MARVSGSKNSLVKCEYCGEMYSTTYKHCPFCNEDGTGRWDDLTKEELREPENPAPRRSGGKRLASSKGGRTASRPSRPDRSERYDSYDSYEREGLSVGAIIGGVLSLVLIIAAICIVISIIRSVTGGKPKPNPTPSTPPSVESQLPDSSQPPESQGPEDTTPPTPTTPAVDISKPTDFTLNRTDFTLDAPGQQWRMKANLVPSDASATVNWSVSDPAIATISWDGVVTAVSKGTTTITASIEGLGERTCIVRCSFKNTEGGETGGNAGGNTGGLSLSKEDFTLFKAGDTWKIYVEGTESPAYWSSSNESVATVSQEGRVTAVGQGNCTISAEVDGVTLTCIVRCTFGG